MKKLFSNIQRSTIGLMILLTACAAPIYTLTVEQLSVLSLEEIKITHQGQHISTRPNMADSCKGFSITQAQIQAFYQHAATSENNNQNNLLKLPCFSKGTTSLSGETFEWIIRSGGIGEFSNNRISFSKMCGVKCCKQIKGIC